MRITIPLIPKGQRRARHTARGGFSRTYKDATQRHEENALMAYLAGHVPEKPISGPVALTFTAYLPIPVSKPKKWKAGAIAGEIRPCVKPDLDNIGKHLKDCLTTMRFWKDDRQVVVLRAEKKYSDNPRWEIEIKGI